MTLYNVHTAVIAQQMETFDWLGKFCIKPQANIHIGCKLVASNSKVINQPKKEYNFTIDDFLI